MKKNKYLYILIFILGMFCFNNDVYAAQELSCLYKKKLLNGDKVWLIQESDGTRKIYKNEKDATIDDGGWYLSNASTENWFGIEADKNGDLIECPAYKRTLTQPEGRVYFYGTSMSKDDELRYGDSQLEWFATELKKSSNSDESTSTNEEEHTGPAIAQELTCLYKKDVGAFKDVFTAADKVLLIQYANGDREIFKNEKDVGITDTGWKTSNASPNNFYGIETDENGNLTECPAYKRTSRSHLGRVYFFGPEPAFDPEGGSGDCELEAHQSYVVEPDITTTPINPIEITEIPDIVFHPNTIKVCNDILTEGGELQKILKGIITIVKILIPIIVLVLGALDFIQAIFAGSEDNMKKATNKFMKRIFIAIAIFLIPTILKLILTIASGIWPVISSDLCGII